MPFDPQNAEQLQQLRDAIDASLQDLLPFRENYHDYLKELVGVYYSKNGNKKVVNVNLLELASTIYLQQLLALPPRINVTTFNRGVRPAGIKLEGVVNDGLRDYTVFSALQRATRSAIGTLGIVKVGIEPKGTIEIDGQQIYANRPFVRHISIDDWVHDMAARAPGEWSFAGHRYEVELEEALNNPDFDEAARKELQAKEDTTKNAQGDEKASAIQGTKAAKSPFKKTVDLWEIFLPKEQLVITLSLDIDSRKPLRVVHWTGPEHGPYHVLYFAEVDSNSMPQSPAQLWMGLHKIVNGLYRKLDRQSSRQKSLMAVQGQDAKDGEKINKASDGDGIVLDRPDAAQELNFGGISDRNFAFMIHSKDLFSWLGGNLESLGGLGPSADTATQDKMITSSSSMRMTMMQNAVQLFTKKVLTDYAYYIWEDPVESYQTEIQVPGFGPLQGTLSPQERTHDFFEHQLEIEPYSMQFQTPGERWQKIEQLLSQFILPLQPAMAQAGIQIDYVGAMKLMSKYLQLPEIEALLDAKGAPLDADTAQPQNGSGKPATAPVTSHTSVRESRPGKSNRTNADHALVQHLMGGNLQPAEKAGAA